MNLYYTILSFNTVYRLPVLNKFKKKRYKFFKKKLKKKKQKSNKRKNSYFRYSIYYYNLDLKKVNKLHKSDKLPVYEISLLKNNQIGIKPNSSVFKHSY